MVVLLKKSSGRLHDMRRLTGLALTVVAVAVSVILPSIVNGYYLYVVTEVAIYAIAGLGLTVVTGWSGQVSLAQAGFFGIGAYGTNYLFIHHIPWLISVVLVALFSGAIGVILGIPTARLKGFYLAIATLAFAELADQVFNNATSVTGGANGIVVSPFQLGALASNSSLWYLSAGILFLVFGVLWHLGQTRMGRCLRAVRDMEVATGSLALNATRLKIVAFMVSAIIGSIAGSLFGQALTFLTPDSFSIDLIVQLLIVVFIGGVDSLAGAIVGATFLVVVQELLQSVGSYQRLVFGLAIIIVIRFLPRGLVSLVPVARRLLVHRLLAPVAFKGPRLDERVNLS